MCFSNDLAILSMQSCIDKEIPQSQIQVMVADSETQKILMSTHFNNEDRNFETNFSI